MNVSFELFPPNTPVGRERLAERAADLARYRPAFVSVTYGASGTDQRRTLDIVAELSSALPVPVAGHLTTVGASIDDVQRVVDDYRRSGVSHIVALRGDPAEGGDSDTAQGYETAADLVAGLRSRADGDRFEISVAAYPEVHPKAASARADLDNLKAKIDAGADRAITQFFFDPDVFLRFRDRAVAAGVDVPIVPGVMPITSFSGISRFASRCGASIPGWLTSLFEGLDDDPEVREPVAATVAVEQCRRLAAGGVDSFHLYTMNKRELPAAICRALGIAPEPAAASSARSAA